MWCWVSKKCNKWKLFKNEGVGLKFWDTTFFFALIQKISLQTLVEIIFRYQ